MKINKLSTLLIVLVLLFATVGTALAAEGDVGDATTGDPICDPAVTDCPEDLENGDDWVHPIVALLAAYMEYQQGDTTETSEDPTCDPLVTDCPEDPVLPICDPLVTDCPVDPVLPEPPSFEDEIAALHEEGVGFGVLVKLLSLSDSGDTPLGTLVEEFKNGQGFKQLYEDYGDPTNKGVGHVKQELKCVENGGEDCAALSSPGKGNGKNKNKEGKPGKGNKKP